MKKILLTLSIALIISLQSCTSYEVKPEIISDEDFGSLIMDAISTNIDRGYTMADITPIFDGLAIQYSRRVEYNLEALSDIELKSNANAWCWPWEDEEHEIVVYSGSDEYCVLHIWTCDGSFDSADLQCISKN